MSTRKLANTNLFLDRVKSALNLESDAELARFVDVNTSTIATWRKRDSVNYAQVLAKSSELDPSQLMFENEYDLKEDAAEYRLDTNYLNDSLIEGVVTRAKLIPICKSLFISSREELSKIHKSDMKIQLSSNILDTTNKDLFAYLYHLERPDLHYKRNDILIIDAKNTAVTQDSAVYLCANDRLPDFKTLVLESRKKIIEFEPFEMKDIEHDLTKFSPYIIGKVVGSLSIQHQLTYNANGDLVSKMP
jgi:hypothetical protein